MRRQFLFTEKHGHGLVQPPAKEGDQWHPEKQELDAHVDRECLCEQVWGLRRLEVLSQAGTNEEHDGDDAIGRERRDGEENNAEPPTIGREMGLSRSAIAKTWTRTTREERTLTLLGC